MALRQDLKEDTSIEKWRGICCFTNRASSFAHPVFSPSIENLNAIRKCHVLVVGAGGLGCELLKNLVLSGFENIEVIDMDTIELSNLNRQFLFRENDIGKSKAETAAEFIRNRVLTFRIIAHNCKIQDKDDDFYRSFDIVIGGLDSLIARRWLNSKLVSLVEFDKNGNPRGIIPFIDGGTEGFKGNSRVIFPKLTACIECTLDLYPPQENFPLCTIAETPRLPEHCVEYVKEIQWRSEMPFGDVELDADDETHVYWVLTRASKRADKFGIKGVDLRLTKGVLKHIIPAVASTNAVIAASCALEALKLASNIARPMDNYLNFSDTDGVYIGVVSLEKNPECIVCGDIVNYIDMPANETFQSFLQYIIRKFELSNPSVTTATENLYMKNDLLPELKKISDANCKKTLTELGISSGDELLVTDESRSRSISLRLRLE